MTERDKILKLIEENKEIFEKTDIDIVESMKGQWFLTRYNKKLRFFDAIATFKTRKQLATILVGELSLDIFSEIDTKDDPEDDRYYNLVDDVETSEDYIKYAERLIEYLK